MELRHIRYFIAAAEQLHFGRAADLLCVTRPAVSQTIADLEQELGISLFQRRPRDLGLTAAGEAFFKRARALMQDLDQAVVETRRIGQGRAGMVTLGYGSLSLRQPVFRQAVKVMRARYPDADIVLREAASSAQVEHVRSGRIDAGFVFVASDGAEYSTSLPASGNLGDLDSLIIEEGGFGVALPVEHPLATRQVLDLEDLTAEGFIMIRSSVANPLFSFAPRIVQEVSNIATQINLISVGLGVGLVAMTPLLAYPADIRVVPVGDFRYRCQLRLVWRRGGAEPLLENFIAVVAEAAGLGVRAPASGALARAAGG